MLADVGCGHLSCAGCFTVQQLITRRSLNSGACTVLRSGLNEFPKYSRYIESIKDTGYDLSSAGKVWQQ